MPATVEQRTQPPPVTRSHAVEEVGKCSSMVFRRLQQLPHPVGDEFLARPHRSVREASALGLSIDDPLVPQPHEHRHDRRVRERVCRAQVLQDIAGHQPVVGRPECVENERFEPTIGEAPTTDRHAPSLACGRSR